MSALEALLSPELGVISSVEEFCRFGDEPPLVGFNVGMADTTPTIGVAVEANAGSLGYDRRQARLAALGEAAERYSASWVPDERLLIARHRDLGAAAVDPARLVRYSPAQLAEPSFDAVSLSSADLAGWVEGRDLATGTAVLAPAQLVYLGYRRRVGERWLGPGTSSGLACGTTPVRALLAALFEVVERDAFMLTWLRRLQAPELDVTGTVLAETDQRYFGRVRARYHALDLSLLTGIPTVGAVVRDPAAGIGLAVGAAAGATVAAAWAGALSEAFQTYAWGRQLRAAGRHRRLARRRDVTSFEDHVAYHLEPARAQASRFLTPTRRVPLAASAPPLLGSPAEVLAGAVARLGRIGQQVIAFDVTSPDLAELGLWVMRVLAPDLCWLDVGYRYRSLGRPRLLDPATVPAELAPSAGLNLEPHPFP